MDLYLLAPFAFVALLAAALLVVALLGYRRLAGRHQRLDTMVRHWAGHQHPYAPADHEHPYAPLAHEHPLPGHEHPHLHGEYAPRAHEHAGVYAPTAHDHPHSHPHSCRIHFLEHTSTEQTAGKTRRLYVCKHCGTIFADEPSAIDGN